VRHKRGGVELGGREEERHRRLTDGAHEKIEALVDITTGVECLFWTSIFLQLELQIGFEGLNLQAPAGVALSIITCLLWIFAGDRLIFVVLQHHTSQSEVTYIFYDMPLHRKAANPHILGPKVHILMKIGRSIVQPSQQHHRNWNLH
jgi:hypothetical protein